MNRLIGWGFLLVLTAIFLFSVLSTHPVRAKQSTDYIMERLWATGPLTRGVGEYGLIVSDVNQDGTDNIISCNPDVWFVLEPTYDKGDFFSIHYDPFTDCTMIAVGDQNGMAQARYLFLLLL